jgi:hypothetical protein
MRRSTVFWDTRCLLTRFACRKSVGHATSRRTAGDASASTFRSVIVFPPPLRESPRSGRRREFLSRSSSRTSVHCGSAADPLGSREAMAIQCQSGLEPTQLIRILNRSDAIDSNYQLDRTEFLPLSCGPWRRTLTIRPFFKFSCSNGSTAPRTWPGFTSCRSSRRSLRIWRLCAAGAASGARGANGSACTRPGGSRRSSSKNGSIARRAADTSSGA